MGLMLKAPAKILSEKSELLLLPGFPMELGNMELLDEGMGQQRLLLIHTWASHFHHLGASARSPTLSN